MNIRFLTLLATLAFLGFSVTALAGKPGCAADNSHPSCGSETTAEYTAALILGGFRFNPVPIILQKGSYSSASTLHMDRPGPNQAPPPYQDGWNMDGEINMDQLIWDEVFLECFEVFGGADIPAFTVGTDWGITQGGRKKSDMATNIRITFRDVEAAGFNNVAIDFGLHTGKQWPRSWFVPTGDTPSYYPLERANFFADDRDNHTSCATGGFTLQSGVNWLEIRRVN